MTALPTAYKRMELPDGLSPPDVHITVEQLPPRYAPSGRPRPPEYVGYLIAHVGGRPLPPIYGILCDSEMEARMECQARLDTISTLQLEGIIARQYAATLGTRTSLVKK